MNDVNKACSCPSGDGSLRHPCPAHSPRADVQPGGSVRLATVPYDRARDLLGDAYNAGTHGIGYSQQTMELHEAIIPAQPSPGGQGAPRCAEHCQNGFADICLASQRDGVICPEDSCDVDDGIRHNRLAARQPAGEPVAWQMRKDEWHNGFDDDQWREIPRDEYEARKRVMGGHGPKRLAGTTERGDLRIDDGGWMVELRQLFDAPPAPAVDLGEFLPAVRMLVVSARTSGGTAGRDTHLCEALDRVEALLPNVDSQAVGK